MNQTNLIFPDILTDSIDELKAKIATVSSFSSVVHVDIIDGLYADNITIESLQLIDIDWIGLAVDVHLLTVDPEDLLGDLHMAGVKRAIGQIERMHELEAYITRCQEYNLEAGLGIDLYTPIESVLDYVSQVGVILLMSVKAGFSGQGFQDITAKIEALRSWGFEGDIVIDGGVGMDQIQTCMDVGANQFAVNSALWNTESVEATYQAMVQRMESHVSSVT